MSGAALVTGASSGIGREFARQLAARGVAPLLVARRRHRLEAVAVELARVHAVTAPVAVCDLATDEGLARCRAAVDGLDAPLDVAVLNAGFGSRGAFHDLDAEREARMVRLNCLAVLDLARHVLPTMVARGRGSLVIVSSAAAFQPMPFMATYAATKAFELALAQALAAELRGTGVRVTAVCPGPVRTEFVANPDETNPRGVPSGRAEDVVATALRALERGRSRATVGPIARAAVLAGTVLPTATRARILARALRPRQLKGRNGSP